MYRKQIRRRRGVLVGLIVTCLVLLSLSFSEAESGPIHTLQEGLATITAPIGEGASVALKPARDLIDWVDETFSAQGENDELEDELAQTRAELARAQAALEDNAQFREQLALPREGELGAYEPVTGRVISRSPTVWYSSVQIDKGSSAGIETDDPVQTGDGLVGRVDDVTPGTSTISLITDHDNAVTAEVIGGDLAAEAEGESGSDPWGIVEAEVGNPDTLFLDYIENEEPVADDAILVTAGWSEERFSSAYPPGIEIGRVADTEPGQGEFQEVEVDPFVDMRELEYVEVLTGGPDRSGVGGG